MFDLCVLYCSFLTIEIVIYVPISIWWKVLFVVSWKTSTFTLISFVSHCFSLWNAVHVLVQWTRLKLRNKTALLFSPNAWSLHCCLIWIKNNWIWRSCAICVHWRKRLRCFDANLLGVKVLGWPISILWRSDVLNKIVLIGRRIHLLLILN